MNQIEALQRLQKLGTPVFETRDASALLAVTAANANAILRRLARQGMLVHLARGRERRSALGAKLGAGGTVVLAADTDHRLV